MAVKVLGLLYHRPTSKLRALAPCDFDLKTLETLAQAHEAAGFDGVLVSQSSTMPDPLMIAAHAAAVTDRLGFLLAHRPGFIAPSLAARMLATFDRLSGGRGTVHVISGADDREMRKDGDVLDKAARYHRSREYVTILRRMWTAPEPFDFDGRFYRLRQAYCDIKPLKGGGPLISWAGASDLAFETAGACADIYAMVGDVPEAAREYRRRALGEAARHDRSLSFAITLCVVLGETEEAAWRQAGKVLERTEAEIALRGGPPQERPASAAFERMLEHAQKADVVGRNLWMALNRVSGGVGNNTTVVGTAEQIVETLLEYYDLGFDQFLLRGFEPLEDAEAFGRELIPLFRKETDARRRPALSS